MTGHELGRLIEPLDPGSDRDHIAVIPWPERHSFAIPVRSATTVQHWPKGYESGVSYRRWQLLYFVPLPHGHGSLRPVAYAAGFSDRHSSKIRSFSLGDGSDWFSSDNVPIERRS